MASSRQIGTLAPWLQTAATLSLLLLASCATQNSPRARLPADLAINQDAGRGNWLIVALRLESGEQVPVVLDTGAAATCFDKSLQPKFGPRLGTGTAWHFGDQHPVGVYAAPGLYLGGTVLAMTGPNVITFDFKAVSGLSNSPYLGILGMDVLEHYCIQLDFAARRLRFLDDQVRNPKAWGKPFPLTDLGDGCVSISENLAGTNTPGSLIDTGANGDGWLMPVSFQQWTNQSATSDYRDAHLLQGTLAGKAYPDVDLEPLKPSLLSTKDAHMQFNGIGLRFLARHLVTLDFPKHTLYLKPTHPGPLIDKETHAAGNAAAASAFKNLKALKKKGQLPGWSPKEKPSNKTVTLVWTLQQPSHYPASVTVGHFQKKHDPSLYYYTLTRASKESPWMLKKAWRTDPKDHLLEEYAVP